MPDHTPSTTIAPGPAIGGWSAGWVGGTVLSIVVVATIAGDATSDELTIPQLGLTLLAGWVVLVAALVVVSLRAGTGDVVDDYAISFRPADALWLPVGVALQLVLVPLLYWPLRAVWSDTFDSARVEERAQDLADRAGGWNSVLLAVLVVVGAPIVEELAYRGLLQRSISTATGRAIGVAVTAAWFSIVHFSPVEYPGLFLAGIVFGIGVAVTGRLGPAIATHAAFNATGLTLVLS